MRKKHVFHCTKCGSPCEIYKKGKGHRLLVCANHGIIASNPLPLLALASAAPAILEAGAGLLGAGKPASVTPTKTKTVTDSLDLPNKNERYVRMALGGK